PAAQRLTEHQTGTPAGHQRAHWIGTETAEWGDGGVTEHFDPPADSETSLWFHFTESWQLSPGSVCFRFVTDVNDFADLSRSC
ncbi:MAG: hypothetical protein ACYCW6_28695, partial [Candidatus Xenobia bacterium]